MHSTPVKRDWPKAPQNFGSTDAVPEFSNIKTHLLNNDAAFKQFSERGLVVETLVHLKTLKTLIICNKSHYCACGN